MNCTEAQKLLQAFSDGELDLLKNLEVEQHLNQCPACTEISASDLALRTQLGSGALHFKAPVALQKRIQKSLSKADKPYKNTPWRWLGVAGGLAFASVLSWSLLPLLAAPAQEDLLAQEIISGHVRSLMANHLTDVISSDQHTVKPWFNGRLDFSPPVKDLAAQGFPLTGGRLDYIGEKTVAALIYRHRQHFINLFIWPASKNSATQTLARQGYHVFHWTQAGMNFWAVSELNDNELQEFVSLVKSSVQ